MKSKHLRILSYNIHKGFSSGNRRFVLKKMREAIRLVHADLVFLQEVLGEHQVHRERVKEWPDQSQFEFLADEIWPHYTYGKNAIYSVRTSRQRDFKQISDRPFGKHRRLDQ